jgi:hypothetical protein
MIRLCIALAGLCLLGAAPVAAARGEAAALSPAERAAAVAAIQRAVEAKYVFPERVPGIVSRLNDGLAAKRYDTDDAGLFAARITEDLRAASNDRHVYLDHDPAQYAAALAEPKGDRPGQGALETLFARQAQRANHGLSEMRILPGNIRYLRITGFQWVEDQTGAVYDDAMRFLRGGDAIIIDLRNNGGGSHAAVRYLLSHFMDGDQLDITFLQAGEEPLQSRTLDHVPAGRLKGRPLYVLINAQVGSAAEAFAYDVQQFRLGTLVGATTAGAANNNSFVPIAPGFMLSVSYGRPVHPVSKSNWEGVGVAPDVAVDPDAALDVAQSLALKALTARPDADPADRADWEWARPAVEARLKPVAIPAARLGGLAGVYGGRRITVRDGELYFERRDGKTARLLPLTEDGLFTVAGYDDHFRIRLTGTAMEMHWIDEPAPTRLARDR